MAGKPRPVQCILAFLNPLLRCASLVVELYHIAGFTPEVRHNEADSGKELSRMPLRSWRLLCERYANWLFDTESYDTGQSASSVDVPLAESARVQSSYAVFGYPSVVSCRSTPLLRDSDKSWGQQTSPVIGTMDIPIAKKCSLQITILIETK